MTIKLQKMDIKKYLDSTYLKTPEQAGVSEEETTQNVKNLINEAIENGFYLVMIRPNYVKMARKMIDDAGADVKVGTVIGFHEGTRNYKLKIAEAQQAINDGVDELDYVVNYELFKQGDINMVKKEVFEGSLLGIKSGKIVKWIIEVAALNNKQIAQLTSLIHDVVVQSIGLHNAAKVFVKSSTGFYKTEGGKPNGATPESIEIMAKYADPLPVKAAGGVRNYDEAVKMIELGVTRIGTSSAKAIAEGKEANGGY
jgi:deoxyribose-phosphate aldolase